MFGDNTTFVIGAGASHEAGLPLGEGLRHVISRKLMLSPESGENINDKKIRSEISKYVIENQKGDEYRDILRFSGFVSEAVLASSSIDNLLEAHKSNKYVNICGKFAISCAILEAEMSSKLYIDRSNIYNTLDVSKIEKTWYIDFGRRLVENCTFSELGESISRIRIIDFNYDRCLQHFLENFLVVYYGVEISQAIEALQKLRIIHPYGSIGSLHSGKELPYVPFGASVQDISLKEMSRNIKIYSEQIEDEITIYNIKNYIMKAETIIFLGFGFHKQNMNIITPDEGGEINTSRVFLSTCGLSPTNIEFVIDDINRRLVAHQNRRVYAVRDKTCYETFTEYGMGFV